MNEIVRKARILWNPRAVEKVNGRDKERDVFPPNIIGKLSDLRQLNHITSLKDVLPIISIEGRTPQVVELAKFITVNDERIYKGVVAHPPKKDVHPVVIFEEDGHLFWDTASQFCLVDLSVIESLNKRA